MVYIEHAGSNPAKITMTDIQHENALVGPSVYSSPHLEVLSPDTIYDGALRPKDKLWRPTYGDYDRGICERRHQALADLALSTCSESSRSVVAQSIESGERFIENTFTSYMEQKHPDNMPETSFAFCVPMRTSAHLRNFNFSSEVSQFFPVLDHLKGLSPFYIERLGISVAPTILERYQSNAEDKAGVLLFAPISPDIMQLIKGWRKYIHGTQVRNTVEKIVADTVGYANNVLGASVVGLGATLPAITRFGQRIPQSARGEMAITTGHGGTVHLIAETVNSLRKGYIEHNGTFGIIGCGSIGFASAEALATRFPESRFAICDTDTERIGRVREWLHGMGIKDVLVRRNAGEVIKEANITVSAVTTDFMLPEGDYAGKAIVEDSMPSHVPQEFFESRGGMVAWVIGQDDSRDGILTPLGGYTYGGSFASPKNIFGCAGEAASVSESKDNSNAISDRVTPDDVKRIGRLFVEYGFTVSEPLQRAGQHILRQVA